MGSAASKTSFPSQKYKGFSKFIKEKYFRISFQFLPLKMIFKAKFTSEDPILRSRRFFRHPCQKPGPTMAIMATIAIMAIMP